MAKSIFDFIYGEDRFEPSDNGVLAQIDALNRRADPNPPTQESTQQTPLPNTWYNNLSRVANRTEQDATGTNIPRNIAQIGKGLIDMGSYVINNPVESANIVGNITSGLVQQVVPESMEWNPEAEDMIDNAASMIADHYKKSYGSMEGFRDYVRETPIDAFADITGVGLLSKFGRQALINAVNTPRFAEKIDELSRQLPETQMQPMVGILGGKKGILDQEELTNMELAKKEIDANKFRDGSVSDYTQQRVWEKYGWNQDSDGSMFFEIDDTPATVNLDTFKNNFWRWKDEALTEFVDKPMVSDRQGNKFYPTKLYSENTSLTLADVLNHEELYGRYPELANVPVDLTYGVLKRGDDGRMSLVDAEQGFSGAYHPRFNRLTLPINKDSGLPDPRAMQTLLHEAQHIVQLREGFQSGGNLAKESWEIMKNQLYRDQADMFGEGYYKMDEIKPLYQYAYDKKQQNYYEDLANRDNLTGIARHINNVYIEEVDDALKNVSAPRRAKTPEYNEYLRTKANLIADYYAKRTQGVDSGEYPKIKESYDNIKAKDKFASIERQFEKAVPDTLGWNKVQKTIKDINKVLKMPRTTMREEFNQEQEIYKLYQRLQGEVQSRNVELRKLLTEGDIDSPEVQDYIRRGFNPEDFDPQKVSPIVTQEFKNQDKITYPKQHYLSQAGINVDADSNIDMNIEGEDFGVLSMVGKPKESGILANITTKNATDSPYTSQNFLDDKLMDELLVMRGGVKGFEEKMKGMNAPMPSSTKSQMTMELQQKLFDKYKLNEYPEGESPDTITPERKKQLFNTYNKNLDAIDYITSVAYDLIGTKKSNSMVVVDNDGLPIAGAKISIPDNDSLVIKEMGSIFKEAGNKLFNDIIQKAKDKGKRFIVAEDLTSKESFEAMKKRGFKLTNTKDTKKFKGTKVMRPSGKMVLQKNLVLDLKDIE